MATDSTTSGNEDSDLAHAVRQGQWQTVDDLLQHEVDDKRRQWAVREGLERADQQVVIQHILPHCPRTMLRFVLEKAVRRSFWRLAGPLLKQDIFLGVAVKEWAVEQACKRATQYDIVQHIFPNYEPVRVTRVAQSELVKRGLWQALTYSSRYTHLLHIPFTWVLTEAVERAGDAALTEVLTIYNKQLDADLRFFLVKEAVSRGLWQAVIELTREKFNEFLLRCPDDEQTKRAHIAYYKWAFRQAIQYVNDDVFLYVCIHHGRVESDCLVSEAVKRGCWLSVVDLIQHGVGDKDVRKWIVKEALHSADDYCLRKILTRYVVADPDLVLLESAVERGMWDVLDNTLQETSFTQISQKRAAIKRGLKRADDLSLIEFILPHCNDEELRETALAETVRRRLWNNVSECLKGVVSVEQRKWAVEQAVNNASDFSLRQILPRCTDDQIHYVLDVAIKRKLWDVAGTLLQRGIGEDQIRRVVEVATDLAEDCELSIILQFCPQSQLESVLTGILSRGMWQGVGKLLKHGVSSTLVRRAVEEASRCADQFSLQVILLYCPEDQLVSVFRELLKRKLPGAFVVSNYITHQMSDSDRLPFLYRCFAYWLTASLDLDVPDTEQQQPSFDFGLEGTSCGKILTYVLSRTIIAVKADSNSFYDVRYKEFLAESDSLYDFASTMYRVCQEHGVRFVSTETMFQEIFVSYVRNLVTSSNHEITRVVLFFYACQTTNLAFQSVAVRRLVRTWNILEQLCISRVLEEDRRWVLLTTVEQKQWAVLKHLADHTLYDDQRSLMIKTALEQEQWDVVMVLADHGMTDDQLRRVHRQVAKHADWNTVLQLFERGANLHRVTKELETANPSRHRPPDERKLDEDEYRKRLAEYTEIETKYKQRLKELETLASQLERDAMDYREAIQASNWAAVLYHIYRGASEDQVKMTLEAAVEKEAQHVLVTLVRLGMDAAQRDWLFREAMTRRLWSVGRALLERPVSRELPRDAASWDTLQRLMEEGQWILVARVMEYDVSDDLRLNVMHHALNRREGSVVAYIISIMEGRVTVKERETVFRQALSKGLWETVRRLVEEKDSTGIAHRDEAMFAAVKQERWDVVEHCVRHGADIDKRDATGLTMLQREINPRHTKELLHQGADQFVVSPEGYSVLHLEVARIKQKLQNFIIQYHPKHPLRREIERKWHLDDSKGVELLVQFHGDINQPDPEGQTPLYNFIRCRLGTAIECALLWGRDVGQKVDYEGETALHVLCWEGLWDALRYVVGRGGDPLAVTDVGESLLLIALTMGSDILRRLYATGENMQQRTVAECIRLGISTHQPKVTDSCYDRDVLNDDPGGRGVERCSPFQQAARQKPMTILKMLYESGACSNCELHRFRTALMLNPYNYLHCESSEAAFIHVSYADGRLQYIDQIATTPRTLQSLCRLVISHHVGVGKPRVREKKVMQLPVLSKPMKQYVLFRDITHPDFGETQHD